MYEKMYHILFNGIADAMEQIEAHDGQKAIITLERVCREAEEVYMSE